MNNNLKKHRRLYGTIGATISLAIAAFYIIITPEEASAASGLQWLILVYGHSFCWILLSVACILWAFTKDNNWSKILAYAALLTYIIFMSTLLIT